MSWLHHLSISHRLTVSLRKTVDHLLLAQWNVQWSPGIIQRPTTLLVIVFETAFDYAEIMNFMITLWFIQHYQPMWTQSVYVVVQCEFLIWCLEKVPPSNTKYSLTTRVIAFVCILIKEASFVQVSQEVTSVIGMPSISLTTNESI